MVAKTPSFHRLYHMREYDARYCPEYVASAKRRGIVKADKSSAKRDLDEPADNSMPGGYCTAVRS